MLDDLTLRLATPADARLLAEHRVAMFRDMGSIHASQEAALLEASSAYFAAALASGEYVGWVAHPTGEPGTAIGGAGVQIRTLLPRPDACGQGLLIGREGLVLNVYVEKAWRRRGVAREMMDEVLRWAGTAGIVRLVLHASAEGRALYETMGFVPTNEMRYTGALPLRATHPTNI
jgi:GNAT superfamily N-acetyltransferase